MFGLAYFNIGRARNRRARIDKIGWVKNTCAIFTLVATCIFVMTMRTFALDIAVWQKAGIINGVDLTCCHFLQQDILIQLVIKMLSQIVILLWAGTAKPVKGEVKAGVYILLHLIHLTAVISDWFTLFLCCKFSGRAVLVCCTNEKHLIPAQTLKAGMHIGRQHGADQISQMLDAVNIGKGGCNKCACHSFFFNY